MRAGGATDAAAVCASGGAVPLPPAPTDKVGLARLARTDRPVHGLRHAPTPGMSGWYVWAGELSADADFFESTHVAHIADVCPVAAVFLSLPPGWRFLSDGDYVDVWFDAALLADNTEVPE